MSLIKAVCIATLGCIFLGWAARLVLGQWVQLDGWSVAEAGFTWFDVVTLFVGGSYIVASAAYGIVGRPSK